MVLGEVDASRVDRGPGAEWKGQQGNPSQRLENSAPQIQANEHKARDNKDPNLDHVAEQGRCLTKCG